MRQRHGFEVCDGITITLKRLPYLIANRHIGLEAYVTAISNSSLSSLIGELCYYHDRNMSIDYFSSTSFTDRNVTGSPQGMAGTAFAGGTFSSGGQTSTFEHVFFQSTNGSIIEYAAGLSPWTNLGEVPLN